MWFFSKKKKESKSIFHNYAYECNKSENACQSDENFTKMQKETTHGLRMAAIYKS